MFDTDWVAQFAIIPKHVRPLDDIMNPVLQTAHVSDFGENV